MHATLNTIAAGLIILGNITAHTPAMASDRSSFNIPAGDLGEALRRYSMQTGQPILFTPEIVAGRTTGGVRGSISPHALLADLLRGTGLEAIRDPRGILLIRRAMPPRATRIALLQDTSMGPPVQSLPAPEQNAVSDIVVTAQRRAESVQKVPISISVATSEMLRKGNITSLQDLSERSPGLKIAKGGGSDQIHIRGTGSGFNPGFEQSVATFVDGVYRSRSRSVRVAFFDVERVEILKGPQTTFFGANAIAGAINITTKTPGNVFAANASALYSPSDGEYNLEAGISAPITEDLAVRFAGRLSGMDGYIHADRLNADGPHLDDKQGRISLHWTPTSRLTINARYDIARLRDKGVLWSEMIGCSPTSRPLGLCARALNLLGEVDDRLDHHSGSAVPDISNLDLDEAALTAKLDLDAVTLVSTSGYLNQSIDFIVDAAPFPVISPIGQPVHFIVNSTERFEQISQEIRLQSNIDGPLSYMIGGYYEHGELSTAGHLGFYFAPLGALAAPTYSPTTPVAASQIVSQTSNAWSAFGSASYEPIEHLTFTASLRYTTVRKKANRIAQIGTADSIASADSFVPAPLAVQQILAGPTSTSLAPFPIASRTDAEFMPAANLRYEFSSDAMVYLSYARGFKAGGFSMLTSDTFRPELVDNYELGVKARWLDRRLTTNLTIFRADYADLQETANIFNVSGALTSVVTNAGRSRTSGVEFSSSLQLGDLALRSELAYIDSYYVSYPNAPCTPLENVTPGTVCPRDLAGRTRAYAPKWSGSAGADYRIGLDGRNSLRLGGTVYFTSGFFLQSSVSDQLRQDGYAKVDLRAAIGPDDGQWELAVIGKNITDKTTTSFGNYMPGAPNTLTALADRPRSVAIQASVKW